MFFLVIQSTYQTIELAICSYANFVVVHKQAIPKHNAALLIPSVQSLLQLVDVDIRDVLFCVVNQGPAPFTTLRSVIATVNGLKASTNVPLVTVNNLDAIATEYTAHKNKMILLNAFAGDYYYWVDNQTGVGKAKRIADLINVHRISHVIGNGGPLMQAELVQNNIEIHALFIDGAKDCCMLEIAAVLGADLFAKDLISLTYVSPLYFKQPMIFKQ